MNGAEILKAMDAGSTLHSSRFGFWLKSPVDARCTNVHNGAARSLVRRGMVKKLGGRWVAIDDIHRNILERMNYMYRKIDGSMSWPNSHEGDLLKMVHLLMYKQ